MMGKGNGKHVEKQEKQHREDMTNMGNKEKSIIRTHGNLEEEALYRYLSWFVTWGYSRL